MAMNPMQRRARNSFLIGFLVSLIIMALVVLFLLYRIKSINEAKEALEALQVQVYVATEDLESGAVVSLENLTLDTVQTRMDTSKVVSIEDFEYTDSNGNSIYNEDGSTVQKEMSVKIDVPAGTIITKDMIAEYGNETTNDQRIQEFNMILLPSQLKNDDYIDIRFQLPTGEDYIVLSKKKVISTTQDAVWMKLSEEEILTVGNAIVEAYAMMGSKLYAIEYTEPGLQVAATPTYPVSETVLNLINNDPNILEKARNALWARYYDQEQSIQRNNKINPAIEQDADARAASVESGNQDEITKVQAAREEYVNLLDGTGEIGTSSY